MNSTGSGLPSLKIENYYRHSIRGSRIETTEVLMGCGACSSVEPSEFVTHIAVPMN
jgi:hypothetical protein